MLIKLIDVDKIYPEKDLFLKVNLKIENNEKIGLIGENGSGKTQLLKIIYGEVSPDRGYMEVKSGLKIGKMSQEFEGNIEDTIFEDVKNSLGHLIKIEEKIKKLEEKIKFDHSEKLMKRYSELVDSFTFSGGYEVNSMISKTLTSLGFSVEDLHKKCSQLSGGELSRLSLSKLILGDFDLILLDEPTNYLDLNGIEFLEKFLSQYKKSFVLVTHDRYFLSRVVNKIWEIENKKVNVYNGNYSYYKVEKKRRYEYQLKEYEKQQKFIEKTKIFIQKNIYGENHKQAQSRKRMLEKLELIEKPVDYNKKYNFRFIETELMPSPILSIKNLSVGYDKEIFSFNFEEVFLPGEKVGILGGNGSGKSTFFKTLLGLISPLKGKYEWNNNVKIAYFDQLLEGVKESPFREIKNIKPQLDETEIRKYLGKFGFSGDEVFKAPEKISGGEKNRLLLSKISLQKSNVLLLDEPTNHLDIHFREALEESIKKYKGLVLVISHDRYFLDRIVNKIILISNKRGILLHGNYSQNESKILQNEKYETLKKNEQKRKRKDKKREGLSKNEKMRIEKKIREIEEEILENEERIKEIENKLNLEGNNLNYIDFKNLTDELESRKNTIEKLFEELDKLNEKLFS